MQRPVEIRGTDSRSYVLLTAAHNEGAYIRKTIECLLAQTLLPKRWVIVSDNSTDGTDKIILEYAEKHDFIRFLRIDRPPGRSFVSKVLALRSGQKLLEGVDFSFIGNLDADVTIETGYFSELITRFEDSPHLGLAGGFVYERSAGEFRVRSQNSIHSVAHAAQLVRRECYEAIGGYAVLRYGGEDWHALLSARMHGWRALAFPDLKIFHHKRTGTSDGLVKNFLQQGKMDYSFGSYLPFEIVKCFRRGLNRGGLGGAIRLFGFLWLYVRREKKSVPYEMTEFLRSEQKRRLLSLFSFTKIRRSRPRPMSKQENHGGQDA